MLPHGVFELRYYLSGDGGSPFEEWFAGLNVAAKVAVALARLEQGDFSNAKAVVGEGCSNIGSIGVPDTACISSARATCW